MTRRLPPWAPFLPRRTDTMSEQESSVEVSCVTRGVEAVPPPPHINLCNPVVSILGKNVNNHHRVQSLCSQAFYREIQGGDSSRYDIPEHLFKQLCRNVPVQKHFHNTVHVLQVHLGQCTTKCTERQKKKNEFM